jgi:hypothetical protein
MIEGEVRIERINPRTALTGELNLRFRNGLRVQRRFRAARYLDDRFADKKGRGLAVLA